MNEFINVEEFWNLLDGKIVDASNVFEAINRCSKYKLVYNCKNCGAVIEKPICHKCKCGILTPTFKLLDN